MRGFSCCIGRKVPSPDHNPPRPAEIELLDKTSTGLPPKPHDLPPITSWGAVSQLSKPEDVAMLRSIFHPEDDISDSGSAHFTKPRSHKSSSTLGLVKSKLKQRLSKDALKRRSQSSVGNSEEEVARRAELRRIRHERIKEELSNEDNYDDDAKSMLTTESSQGSLTDAPASLPRVRDQQMVPFPDYGNGVSIEHATRVVIHSRQQSEITVQSIPKARSDAFFMHEVRNRAVSPIYRRHSSVDLQELLRADTTLVEWIDSNGAGRGSIPRIPEAPHIFPQRLPSIDDAVLRRSSWRLSFVARRRSSRFRQMSYESTGLDLMPAGRTISSKIDLKWLRSQGLGLPSPTTSDPVTDMEDNKITYINSFGSVDSTDSTEAGKGTTCVISSGLSVHLKDLNISRRLASESQGIPSTITSAQASQPSSVRHFKNCSIASDKAQYDSDTKAKHDRWLSKSSPFPGSDLPVHWDRNIFGDWNSQFLNETSMDGATAAKSPSAKSKLRLIKLIASVRPRSMTSTSVSETWSKDPSADPIPLVVLSDTHGSSVSLDLDVQGKAPTEVYKPIRPARRFTVDSSISASETSSYRRRESELDHIERRFQVPIKKGLPIESRFTEVFDDDDMTPQIHPEHRYSAFFSLQLECRGFIRRRDYRIIGLDGSKDGHDPTTPSLNLSVTPSESNGGFGQYFLTQEIQLSDQDKALLSEVASAPPTAGISPGTRNRGVTMLWNQAVKDMQSERTGNIANGLKMPRRSSSTVRGRKTQRSANLDTLDDGIMNADSPISDNKSKQKAVEDRSRAQELGADMSTKSLVFSEDEVGVLNSGRQQSNLLRNPRKSLQISYSPKHNNTSQYFSDRRRRSVSAPVQTSCSETSNPHQARYCEPHLEERSRFSSDSSDRKTTRTALCDFPRSLSRGRASKVVLATPPQSWARFPSHTREQRTATASPQDGVETRDFAVSPEMAGHLDIDSNRSKGKGVLQCLSPVATAVNTGDGKLSTKKSRSSLMSNSPPPRGSKLQIYLKGSVTHAQRYFSLPTKLSSSFRASAMRMRATRGTIDSQSLQGRRTSTQLARPLRYPELELVRGERGDDELGSGGTECLLNSVQKEVDEELRIKERGNRRAVVESIGTEVSVTTWARKLGV